jgi:hypothetical protein
MIPPLQTIRFIDRPSLLALLIGLLLASAIGYSWLMRAAGRRLKLRQDARRAEVLSVAAALNPQQIQALKGGILAAIHDNELIELYAGTLAIALVIGTAAAPVIGRFVGGDEGADISLLATVFTSISGGLSLSKKTADAHKSASLTARILNNWMGGAKPYDRNPGAKGFGLMLYAVSTVLNDLDTSFLETKPPDENRDRDEALRHPAPFFSAPGDRVEQAIAPMTRPRLPRIEHPEPNSEITEGFPRPLDREHWLNWSQQVEADANTPIEQEP